MKSFTIGPAGTENLLQAAFQILLTIAKAAAIFSSALLFLCSRHCHSKSAETVLPAVDKPACVMDTRYPVWFFNPPEGTVAGFYHDTVSSLTDAKIRAAGYNSMRFYGKYRYYEDNRSDDFQDSIFFYFNSSDTVLAESLTVADSFFVCCTGNIYLLAMKNAVIDTARVDACAYSRKIEEKGYGKITATGEYRLEYYNQSLSWMHAEENAVKELCDQVLYHFASLRKKTGSEMSTTIMKQFDLSVRKITIEQRTFDTENNLCRVTISCDTSDVIPTLPDEEAP